ncbi:hypothetical protein LTS18_002407 [Coniosporium uncinatum]|uniref:Uncharacterized protein n=1 Tax=Coniosporium uncinatum TaxID=93489 RepID=A0ACC3D7P9_9PEZI|nr:hypothetical protein LTS18_002407 [Coniosporium uncinatum]
MGVFSRRSSRQEPFDVTHRFSTSWLLPPPFLLALRALISLYIFVTLIFILAWDGAQNLGVNDERHFSYFTNLTNWGLAFYFLFAALHTGSYWRRGAAWLEWWWGWLQWLHGVFYSSIVVFPFVVTIVYWSILAPSHFSSTNDLWRNTSQHALNSVFAFLEIFIPRTDPPSWWHLIPLTVILALYLALTYLTYGTQHFYVYNFLDWAQVGGRGVVAGYCIGILVGMWIVFALVKGLISGRKWVVEGKMGMDGKFTRKASRRVNEADMDIEIQQLTQK